MASSRRPPPDPQIAAIARAKKLCKLSCCTVSDERRSEIAASVVAGRGRSMFDGMDGSRLFGPNCRCGVARKPPGLAKYVEDDGYCVVHPDSPPQPWVKGAGDG